VIGRRRWYEGGHWGPGTESRGCGGDERGGDESRSPIEARHGEASGAAP